AGDGERVFRPGLRPSPGRRSIMSPCCIAAATATAVLTALIVVGLMAFVLVTDGFGLGILLSTLLAVAFQRLQWIGPCPRLMYGLSLLLAVRAAWLLATTRRELVIAVWRLACPKATWVVLHLTPTGRLRRARAPHHPCVAHADGTPTDSRIGPRP